MKTEKLGNSDLNLTRIGFGAWAIYFVPKSRTKFVLKFVRDLNAKVAPYELVDEFQDTTYAQYGFLQSAFQDPRVILTSVGDSKQRIMIWAGARSDAFERFEEDFTASSIPLLFNSSISVRHPDWYKFNRLLLRKSIWAHL